VKTLAASLWGALMVILAFPTVDLAFPILLAWPPLLVVARRLTWKRRLVAGWLMGTVYQAVLFRWIDFTMDVMTNFPDAIGPLFVLLFAAWHGTLGGVFLALAEPVRRAAVSRWPWGGAIALGALWVALEWLWPFIFPWWLGNAFWRVPWLTALEAWTGPAGLSFWIMVLAAAAADYLVDRRWRPLRPALVTAGVFIALGLGWWVGLQAMTPRRVLRVAVLQPNYALEDKRRMTLAVRSRLLARLEGMLRELPPDRFDLLVATEGSFPFQWRLDADQFEPGAPTTPADVAAVHRLQAAVREGPRAPLVLGGIRQPAEGPARNSAVLLGADGRIGFAYDKRILVPFGEYLPERELFTDLFGEIQGIGEFGAGSEPCLFEAAGEKLACGICYEALFADETRDDIADARILVNLTIDVWFGDSTAPWFHLMAQASRAAELGVPLIRGALTGISAIVGPDGAPDQLLGLHEQGVLAAELPLLDVTTPYRVVGPLFSWLASAVALGLLGLALARRRELFPPGVVEASVPRGAKPKRSPRAK
jgi:apolipoprotein N-acyltransferase